jgi:hypothetical protein
MRLVSTALAILAALVYAVSVTLQQPVARSAATAAARRALDAGGAPRRPWLAVIALLGSIMRDPAWLVGWLLNVVGFGLHAIALHFGSITIVQAVLVVQLMIALGLTAAARREWPSPRDWCAAAAVSCGVVILIVLRGDVRQSTPGPQPLIVFAVLASVGIGSLLTVARLVRHRAQLRTGLVSIGAGISFCTSAVFIVVFTDALHRLGLAAALHWSLPCLLVSSVLGSILVQESFASGSMATALTATTITDPALSCVAGFVLFDVTDPVGPAELAGVAASVLLIAVGVWTLATSATLHLDYATDRQVTARPVTSSR